MGTTEMLAIVLAIYCVSCVTSGLEQEYTFIISQFQWIRSSGVASLSISDLGSHEVNDRCELRRCHLKA